MSLPLLATARLRLWRGRHDLARRHRALAVGAPLVMIAVAVGTAGSVAFADRTHPVNLIVDGQQSTVHTSAGSVSRVLSAAHVQIGGHDVVEPSLTSSVRSGDTIVVRHGRPLVLTVGTSTRLVWITDTTVGAALSDLGLDAPAVYLSASRSRMIGLVGLSLSVRLPQAITVVQAGRSVRVSSTAPTVAALLRAEHITLGAKDTVSQPLGAYPTAGMVVTVTRIHGGQQVTDTVITPSVTHVSDASLYVGQSSVTAGQPGVVRHVYAVVYADGRLVSRRLVSQVTTQVMRPEVVRDGTAPRPAPVYSGSADGLDWGALADCESGGNPGAVSADGLYFGLYQFSSATWAAVGGSGSPAAASAAEQTARAEALYARGGRGAWPVCGQYL